jgi:hypothetical protein
MRDRALALVLVVLASGAAQAQMTWQPAQPPLVNAGDETWFRARDAIAWNGDLYYPAGALEAFNRYQMVRAGTYRGIPIYVDATLEPNSAVFVPKAGGWMQRYERKRTEISGALGVNPDGFITQAAPPPTVAEPYDVGGSVTGTAPAGAPAVTITNSASPEVHPKGLNGVWLTFSGRRWVSSGKAVARTDDFVRIGEFRGAPVYQRCGDDSTIYVPIAGDLIVPFMSR